MEVLRFLMEDHPWLTTLWLLILSPAATIRVGTFGRQRGKEG